MTLFFGFVEIRLHAENHLPGSPGSGLKVCDWVGAVDNGPITLCNQYPYLFDIHN